MNILFICKYNRFRSQVAEKYFNKINKNKAIKATSAGLIQVDKPLSLPEKRRNKFIKKKFNLDLTPKSRALTVSLIEWADKIIIVASDIPRLVFNHPNDKKKVVFWKIKDDTKGEIGVIDSSTKKIINKVNNLVKQLERAR